MRTALPRSLVLFLAILVLAALPAAASHYRYANIEWCAAPDYPDPYPIYFDFSIEVAERRFDGQVVGDPAYQIFDYGDGTFEVIALTVTEVHGDWFLATGSTRHLYGGSNLLSAGLTTCCRINGSDGGDDLNNLSDGPFTVLSLVYTAGEFQCSPEIDMAPVTWLSGGLGDTFTIPVPASHGQEDEKLGCALNIAPAGMTIDPETCVITWTPTSGDPAKLWAVQVAAQGINIYTEALFSEAVADFLLGLDAARPVCRIQSTIAGPPTQIQVFIQDARSGLASIQVLESTNATVSIPPFQVGSRNSLIVTGTKVNQSQLSRIRLRVTDQAGNAIECDPVLTEEVRVAGKPQVSNLPGIPPEERFVTVLNGDPGLRLLEIEVNGRKFKMTGLRPGEERTLDVGAAVIEGRSSNFVLRSHGKPGASATVMIWEGQGN